MNDLLKKILLSANVVVFCVFISFFATANQQDVSTEVNVEKAEKLTILDENEEKIVISIINFGRSNPFEPYKETVKKKVNKNNEEDLDELPYPPSLRMNETDSLNVLMGASVNGILYDPFAKSVAIVNISGADYMLREGDVVQGVALDKIDETHVTLRYEANTYTVGVGEIIEGAVQYDPVDRRSSLFGEAEYKLPDIDVEELIQDE